MRIRLRFMTLGVVFLSAGIFVRMIFYGSDIVTYLASARETDKIPLQITSEVQSAGEFETAYRLTWKVNNLIAAGLSTSVQREVFIPIAESRMRALENVVASNPEAFTALALPPDVFSVVPTELQSYVEAPITADGYITNIGTNRAVLETNRNERFTLYVPENSQEAGAYVVITGSKLRGGIVVDGIRTIQD